MSTTSPEFQPDARVRDKFIHWIEQFDLRHARSWAHRYNADPEAAMCEAMFWGILSDCGVSVEPNACLNENSPAPDFVCQKAGHRFYFEATCIQIRTAVQATRLRHIPSTGAQGYGSLNDAIFKEVRSKTPQCANLDAPCVLGVGTFHLSASVLCIDKRFVEWMLTGETKIAWGLDVESGQATGSPYQVTEFKSANFLRRKPLVGYELARQPISALVVSGLGRTPPSVYGVLHPSPVRDFNAELLGRIPFCKLKPDIQNATLTVEWTEDPE